MASIENTHVYCTLCKNGEILIEELMKDGPFVEPKACRGCDSCNPEDSVPFKERPNYQKM